ncbi:hypothetical protein CW736_11440 [Nonlabens sp. MB-3u-79]|uniref:hypothetical protein n=1 Tax=Nonlabens sp. MB-3u-79 TaxID=2058134 RepID=UPI000C314896|nr:hypothetical protein [Nonlabens sp. MB-3u-79]AUC79937.1 hypothetical protein CW736_11440 [Nonlabens sp. MB-3u-79]
MSKKYNRIKYLGYYQIIGGIIGVLMILFSVYGKFNSNGFFLFSLIVFNLLCGLSIYSGILLIQKKYLKGLKFSVFTQGFQVLSFVLFGYIFDFALGVYLRLTIKLTNDSLLGLDFGFASWNLSRNANPDLTELNINFVALVLLFFIANNFDRMKTEISLKNIE